VQAPPDPRVAGCRASGAEQAPVICCHVRREHLRARGLEGEGEDPVACELLERLLRAFIPRVAAKSGAKGPIAKFGSVSAMPGAAPEGLMAGEGVGGTAAASVGNTHLAVQQVVVQQAA